MRRLWPRGIDTWQGQTGGNAVATKGANLTYNALGQLATIARTNFFGVGPAPDIATSTFAYDGANRLTQIANTTNGGTAIDAYSWTYDAADRVTSMTTTTDGTATYSYDNTNQVTGASYTGTGQPANESYSYDSNGNRTNTGYSTGTNNQLASDGTFNYTYDHEGNRSTRTRISGDPANDYLTTYTWDYRDRLTDVNFYNNSNVLTKHVHYTYDVFDHLIGKQVDDTGGGSYDRAEFYVYDGSDVVLQFDGSGALTERYLNCPSASGVDNVLAEEDVTSLSSPGTVTWPLTDNLDTVRDVVDSTGAVIDHIVYNSFGQIASESNASVHHLQGYAGGILDADTGMVNDWHRWYDPRAGRWTSEDALEFSAGDANLVRYVGNAAASIIDPSGLKIEHRGDHTQEDEDRLMKYLQTIAEDEFTTAGCLAREALNSPNTLTIVWGPGENPKSELKGNPIRNHANELYLPSGSANMLGKITPASVNLDGVDPELAGMIVVAHELGHALLGLQDPRDAANANCGNVTLVENEFRRSLGVRPRDNYNGQPIPSRGNVNKGDITKEANKRLEYPPPGLGGDLMGLLPMPAGPSNGGFEPLPLPEPPEFPFPTPPEWQPANEKPLPGGPSIKLPGIPMIL